MKCIKLQVSPAQYEKYFLRVSLIIIALKISVEICLIFYKGEKFNFSMKVIRFSTESFCMLKP